MSIFLLNDEQITRWWQLKHFLCSPRKLGKIPILTSIFFKWGETTNEISNKVRVQHPTSSCLTSAGRSSKSCHVSLTSLLASQLCIKACTIGPGQQMERNSVAILPQENRLECIPKNSLTNNGVYIELDDFCLDTQIILAG